MAVANTVDVPVTAPVVEILAIELFDEIHVPPVVVFVSEIVVPLQTLSKPVIVPAKGRGFITTE